jgi:hypothetical protein
MDALKIIASEIWNESDRWDLDDEGDDAAASIIAALEKAGFCIVRKEPPVYMTRPAKAAYRMSISVGRATDAPLP